MFLVFYLSFVCFFVTSPVDDYVGGAITVITTAANVATTAIAIIITTKYYMYIKTIFFNGAINCIIIKSTTMEVIKLNRLAAH